MIESLFRADHGLLATTNLDSIVILMVMNETSESFIEQLYDVNDFDL